MHTPGAIVNSLFVFVFQQDPVRGLAISRSPLRHLLSAASAAVSSYYALGLIAPGVIGLLIRATRS
jgi:hypothetical protein